MKTAIGCAILLVVVVFLYERHPAFFNFLNTPATPAYGYNQTPQIDPQTGQPVAAPYEYPQPVVQPPAYQYPQPVVQPPVYTYPQPVYQYPVPVCPPRPIYVQPYQPYKSVVVTPWFRSAFR